MGTLGCRNPGKLRYLRRPRQGDAARFEAAAANAIVTISMPTYNTAPGLLARAVHGVLTQTEDRLLLLVVNDGGTQACWSELADIDDPRLVCIDMPVNAGPFACHAEVLRRCTTRWWAMHDADDLCGRGRLAAIMAEAQNDLGDPTADAVLGGYTRVSGGRKSVHPPSTTTYEITGVPFTAWCTSWHMGVWRADWLRAVGGINPGYRVAYDAALQSLAWAYGRVKLVNDTSYTYVRHADSLTCSATTGMNSNLRKSIHKSISSGLSNAAAAYPNEGLAGVSNAMLTSIAPPVSPGPVNLSGAYVIALVPDSKSADDLRGANLSCVEAYWSRGFTNFTWVPAYPVYGSSGEYCRAATVNRAVASIPQNSVFVVTDTDVIIPDTRRLLTAVTKVCSTAPGTHIFISPFSRVVRLTAEASADYREFRSGLCLTCSSNTSSTAGGGIFITTTGTWKAVGGMDEDFKGWGCEDNMLSYSIQKLCGVTHLPCVLYHLYHKPQVELAKDHGAANMALFHRKTGITCNATATGDNCPRRNGH